LLIRLVSPDELGAMLGIYGLVGKLSAVIGPALYFGIVAVLLGSLDAGAYQIAVGTLFVLLAIGVAFLLGVPEGRRPDEEPVVVTEPAIVPPGEAAR
jgi:UMF1 family MFS transporter